MSKINKSQADNSYFNLDIKKYVSKSTPEVGYNNQRIYQQYDANNPDDLIILYTEIQNFNGKGTQILTGTRKQIDDKIKDIEKESSNIIKQETELNESIKKNFRDEMDKLKNAFNSATLTEEDLNQVLIDHDVFILNILNDIEKLRNLDTSTSNTLANDFDDAFENIKPLKSNIQSKISTLTTTTPPPTPTTTPVDDSLTLLAIENLKNQSITKFNATIALTLTLVDYLTELKKTKALIETDKINAESELANIKNKTNESIAKTHIQDIENAIANCDTEIKRVDDLIKKSAAAAAKKKTLTAAVNNTNGYIIVSYADDINDSKTRVEFVGIDGDELKWYEKTNLSNVLDTKDYIAHFAENILLALNTITHMHSNVKLGGNGMFSRLRIPQHLNELLSKDLKERLHLDWTDFHEDAELVQLGKNSMFQEWDNDEAFEADGYLPELKTKLTRFIKFSNTNLSLYLKDPSNNEDKYIFAVKAAKILTLFHQNTKKRAKELFGTSNGFPDDNSQFTDTNYALEGNSFHEKFDENVDCLIENPALYIGTTIDEITVSNIDNEVLFKISAGKGFIQKRIENVELFGLSKKKAADIDLTNVVGEVKNLIEYLIKIRMLWLGAGYNFIFRKELFDKSKTMYAYPFPKGMINQKFPIYKILPPVIVNRLWFDIYNESMQYVVNRADYLYSDPYHNIHDDDFDDDLDSTDMEILKNGNEYNFDNLESLSNDDDEDNMIDIIMQDDENVNSNLHEQELASGLFKNVNTQKGLSKRQSLKQFANNNTNLKNNNVERYKDETQFGGLTYQEQKDFDEILGKSDASKIDDNHFGSLKDQKDIDEFERLVGVKKDISNDERKLIEGQLATSDAERDIFDMLYNGRGNFGNKIKDEDLSHRIAAKRLIIPDDNQADKNVSWGQTSRKQQKTK